MNYEFFTNHHPTPDINTVEFIQLDAYQWRLNFSFYAIERGESTYTLDFSNFTNQSETLKKQLESIFVDSDGYDYLYFGYTARYIYNAFVGLYHCGIEKATFREQLDKIFEIQRLNAEKEEEMSF